MLFHWHKYALPSPLLFSFLLVARLKPQSSILRTYPLLLLIMYIVLFTFLSLLLPASAWLPGQNKTIVAHDGTNLFDSTPGYYRNSTKNKRWSPSSGKIRGVNLGSMFVFEPWLAESAWSSMGCGSYNSEFDCVSGLGQTQANTVFQSHWASWITQSDISQMHYSDSSGILDVRVDRLLGQRALSSRWHWISGAGLWMG
jgi:hypothetical protein